MKLLAVAIAAFFFPTTAHAYFDPGTGSILIQIVVGAMATAAVFWRRIKLSIVSWFSRDKSKENRKDAAQ